MPAPMTLQPSNVETLTRALAEAARSGQAVAGIDLSALNRLVEHRPEDMTVTVEAGLVLEALQSALAKHQQWLPLDPPQAGRLSIRELIDTNVSGPRRFGYGTVRDYLLGVTVALADGTVIHSGGKVVKNVAGYDLLKLFVGGHGSLGVVLEATFKLWPRPETERFLGAHCATLERADQLLEAVLQSELTPVVLDLHQTTIAAEPGVTTVVAGFAGTRQEVEWQLALAADLGLDQPASLDYEAAFWQDPAPAHRLSVLPSKIVEAIRALKGAPYVARAGNGIIYHRGAPGPRHDAPALTLMRRMKDAFDPKHVLPEAPL